MQTPLVKGTKNPGQSLEGKAGVSQSANVIFTQLDLHSFKPFSKPSVGSVILPLQELASMLLGGLLNVLPSSFPSSHSSVLSWVSFDH
jgi:hypothetical protein